MAFDQGQGFARSLQVTATGALWKSINDFLFNFKGNHGPICKRFQDTALWKMRVLNFDLSRSLQVKAIAAIRTSIDMETLSPQYHQVFFKNQGGVGI